MPISCAAKTEPTIPAGQMILKKRMQAHNQGKGAKYTKGRRPVTLVYYEEFETKEDAMRREWEIKHLSKKEKINLISENP